MRPVEVTLWKCGECGGRHDTVVAATVCCVCKCGRPLTKAVGHQWRESECSRCMLKMHIRSRQEAMRKHAKSLDEDRSALARLQAEKRALDDAEKSRVLDSRTRASEP